MITERLPSHASRPPQSSRGESSPAGTNLRPDGAKTVEPTSSWGEQQHAR